MAASRASSLAAAVATALGLTACGGPPAATGDEGVAAPTSARTTDGPAADPSLDDPNMDPWVHYARARDLEAKGDVERAIFEYGETINRLPLHNATRPVLDLGKLHQRLGHPAPAERCFREVLDTFPQRADGFRTNPDFRDAALGLAPLLGARPSAADELAALRARFLGELGGSETAWAAGPAWASGP